jgi:multicomponent Na+:H+ antiporter subunit E
MKDTSPPLPAPGAHSLIRTALVRGLCFFALWVVLMPSAKPADLFVGLLAAIIATTASLRLLERTAGHVRFGVLLAFMPHFLWQSVLAGVDVARRALAPRMALRTGFVTYRTAFPPGLARVEFAMITSLLPGSVPAGETEDAIIYHCLDTAQPIAQQMAAEEQRLAGALISGERHA